MKKKKLTAIKQGGSQSRGQSPIHQKHDRDAHPPRPKANAAWHVPEALRGVWCIASWHGVYTAAG